MPESFYETRADEKQEDLVVHEDYLRVLLALGYSIWLMTQILGL